VGHACADSPRRVIGTPLVDRHPLAAIAVLTAIGLLSAFDVIGNIIIF
jgi:hypothetical protein